MFSTNKSTEWVKGYYAAMLAMNEFASGSFPANDLQELVYHLGNNCSAAWETLKRRTKFEALEETI